MSKEFRLVKVISNNDRAETYRDLNAAAMAGCPDGMHVVANLPMEELSAKLGELTTWAEAMRYKINAANIVAHGIQRLNIPRA